MESYCGLLSITQAPLFRATNLAMPKGPTFLYSCRGLGIPFGDKYFFSYSCKRRQKKINWNYKPKYIKNEMCFLKQTISFNMINFYKHFLLQVIFLDKVSGPQNVKWSVPSLEVRWFIHVFSVNHACTRSCRPVWPFSVVVDSIVWRKR